MNIHIKNIEILYSILNIQNYIDFEKIKVWFVYSKKIAFDKVNNKVT